MNRLTIILFSLGAVMFFGSIAYAFLAPSPVDVLVKDYKDGYGYKGTHTGTITASSSTTTKIKSESLRAKEVEKEEDEEESDSQEEEPTALEPVDEGPDELAAAQAVKASIASELLIAESEIWVGDAVAHDWPDGCLGLGDTAEMCTMALVPGFEIEAEAEGKIYTYRTNGNGSVVRKEQ